MRMPCQRWSAHLALHMPTTHLNWTCFFSAIFASPDWFLVTSSATARSDAQNGWVPLLETKLAPSQMAHFEMPFSLVKYEMYEFGGSTCITYCPMPVYQPTKRTTRKTVQVLRWLVNFLSPTHVSGFNIYIIVHQVYIYHIDTIHTG